MSKVFIAVGHGGADPGAVANGLRESDMNLVMALSLKSELDRHGVTTGISRTKDENDPLSEEIKKANAFGPDLAVACHNNAGGGDGFEVLYQTNEFTKKSYELARSIEKEVLKIGQNTRGCKIKQNSNGQDYFGFLREVRCPSVICEGVFLDSSDRLIADTEAEQQAFGIAYAKGILKTLGIEYIEEVVGVPEVPAWGNKLEISRYNTIAEVPIWGKEAIQVLVDKKYIADGNNLKLTEDMVRLLVINYRAGAYK